MIRKLAAFALLALAASLCHGQLKASTVQVNLTWDAPSSSPDPVAGYNAYRAPSGSTNFMLLNAAVLPLTPTAYTDLTVSHAATYDYIVESVDAQGVTSTPSNVASVTLPYALPPSVGQPTVTINP